MNSNEKKILIVSVCCIALIAVAAYYFSGSTATASHQGNGQGQGQGKALATQYEGEGHGCTENPDLCGEDCDQCSSDEESERKGLNEKLQDSTEKSAPASSFQKQGERQGRGCGQKNSASGSNSRGCSDH